MAFTLWANTIIKENILVKETIRLLDKRFVIVDWANTQFEGTISQQGDTVSVQTFPRISFTTGSTAWADITASSFTITKETLTIDELQQLRVPVTNLQEIQSNLNLLQKIGEQIAYSMRDKMEQHVIATVKTGAWSKLNESSAVTLSASNIYANVEEIRVVLAQNNVYSQCALFVDPMVASLIRQSPVFDGFREGLDVRKEAFVWRIAGFEVYESNNIQSKHIVAMDRDAVHFAVQWTGYDERKEPKGFTTNVISEFVMWAKVFTENAKRIVTKKYA